MRRFCVEHDSLVCDVCGLTSHKSCNAVLSFEEASKGVRSGREVTQIDAAVKKLFGQYEDMFKVSVECSL